MVRPDWRGVFPAVTTQFKKDHSLDLEATQKHIGVLIESGSRGLVMLGTVGENNALSAEEKRQVLHAARDAAAGRVPVLSGVAEYTTDLAANFARECEDIGIDGLMVLPCMVYKSDPRETLTHFRSVARASGLPIMVYNNPVSYGVDITPEMFAELSDEDTIVAIKESSENVRRITDLTNVVGDRYILFSGVDDLVLESVLLGAVGWVAGLVNVFPRESVALFDWAVAGRWDDALSYYRWLTPIFHLDTEPKLVQYIKLGQQVMGLGSEVVRSPRLVLESDERASIIALFEKAAAERPIASTPLRTAAGE